MIREVKLGEICNILNGYAFKSKEYVEDGIRIIRITNVQKGIIQDTDPKYYKIDKIETLKNYMLKENDLLISLTGNVGRVGQISKELLPAGLNQRVGCIRIKEKKDVSIDYLYQYFNSYNFERDCINNSKGIAQKNLSTEWLKNYKMKIPSLDEQKRIAIELRHIQRIKDLKQQQLKELDQLIKSQFVEMFDNKGFKKEKLKNNIIEMFIGPFGSALKNEYFVEKENGYSVVYEQKHAINKNIKEFRWVDENKYKSLERFNVKPGDIIVSCRGTVGKTYIIPDDAPIGIMHPSIMKIRVKKEKYIPKFFEKVLEEYLEDKERETTGAIIKMGIKASQLEKEYFIIPDLVAQTKYLNIVKQIDKQKFEIEKSLKEIQELYESLMEKYFG